MHINGALIEEDNLFKYYLNLFTQKLKSLDVKTCRQNLYLIQDVYDKENL